MSKSLGNITTIENAVKNILDKLLRLSLLSAQYKQPLDWSDTLLNEQSKVLDKWYQCIHLEMSDHTHECFKDLLDDMNTPFIFQNYMIYFNNLKTVIKIKKRIQ